jgi:hypothetical protein
MWRANSYASVDDEVTVDVFEPDLFPLPGNAQYPDPPVWFAPYQEDMLHIRVSGSSCFLEPGDLLFHMSTLYAENGLKLKFHVTPCDVGDYGLYQLVRANSPGQSVDLMFSNSVKVQTKQVTFPQIPAVLWSLCGDDAPKLVPSGWFEKTAHVVELDFSMTKMASFGGPFSTGQIAEKVDRHPVIKDTFRPIKTRRLIAESSSAYYAYLASQSSKNTALLCSQAGTSTGSFDGNRNYFSLTSMLGCCGQRVKHPGT